jgi:hypothetical protein
VLVIDAGLQSVRWRDACPMPKIYTKILIIEYIYWEPINNQSLYIIGYNADTYCNRMLTISLSVPILMGGPHVPTPDVTIILGLYASCL